MVIIYLLLVIVCCFLLIQNELLNWLDARMLVAMVTMVIC